MENSSRSMLICSEFDLNVENVQQAPDLALIHEGSEESWMTMSTPALDSNLMGVELSPRLQLRNLISYSDLSAKVVAFIQPSLASQGEHIDYNFSVLLPAPVCKNDARRVCPLFIYLVIWAPKNYIAGAAQNFYGILQVEVIQMEACIPEFPRNHVAFVIRELKAQKQRPVGLDDFIDGGIASNTTRFTTLKDIEVFRITKLKSQKQRPDVIGLNRDCLLYIPLLYYFVKTTQGWSTFANSRARHELNKSSELDSVPELIAKFPIMSDPAGSLPEFDPESDLESIPHAISSQTLALRPARARVVHNPLLLPHFGTVAKSPVGRTWYGLFKPFLMTTRAMSRHRTSVIPLRSIRAPPSHLSSDDVAVVCSIPCLKRLIFTTPVNISIGK